LALEIRRWQPPTTGIRVSGCDIGRDGISWEEIYVDQIAGPFHRIYPATIVVERSPIATILPYDRTSYVTCTISAALVRSASFLVRWRREGTSGRRICVQRGVRGRDIAEAFKKVDLAVGSIAVADGPAGWALMEKGSIQHETYNAGHRPQSLPGMWAKSPISRPWRKESWLSSQILLRPVQPLVEQGRTVLLSTPR